MVRGGLEPPTFRFSVRQRSSAASLSPRDQWLQSGAHRSAMLAVAVPVAVIAEGGCRAAETSSGHKEPVPRGDGWLMCTTLARQIFRGKFATPSMLSRSPAASQRVGGLPAGGASVVADLKWEL